MDKNISLEEQRLKKKQDHKLLKVKKTLEIGFKRLRIHCPKFNSCKILTETF